MTESASSAVNPADIHAGYQAAVALWVYEGNLVWAKFNAFLVANSIVLAIYGLTLGSAKVSPPFMLGLPIAGLVLCAVWWGLTARGLNYHKYWILSARELEDAYLAEPVKTVARGGSFAAGKPVSITVGGKALDVRVSRASRMLSAGVGAYLVIGVFAVLYVLMFFG